MTENRIKAALAGPDFSPAPIVAYEYEDDQDTAQGQVLDVTGTEDQTDVFSFEEVRIQVDVDTHYWIDTNPAIDEGTDKMDILFAGVVYHEVVDPAHKMAFITADGATAGKLFRRPVKRITEE